MEIIVVGIGARDHSEFNERELRSMASLDRYFHISEVEGTSGLITKMEDIASGRITEWDT